MLKFHQVMAKIVAKTTEVKARWWKLFFHAVASSSSSFTRSMECRQNAPKFNISSGQYFFFAVGKLLAAATPTVPPLFCTTSSTLESTWYEFFESFSFSPFLSRVCNTVLFLAIVNSASDHRELFSSPALMQNGNQTLVLLQFFLFSGKLCSFLVFLQDST